MPCSASVGLPRTHFCDGKGFQIAALFIDRLISMPVVDHTEKLGKGVEAWNQWYTGADEHAILRGANLSGRNLSGADFIDTDFTGADLSHADLSGALLSGANLNGVNLTGASFLRARIQGTVFANTNLMGAQYLATCIHTGPSTLDERTITRSWPLPQEFLKGCGLSDTLIEYLPKLIPRAIRYSSCFISHSTLDQEFAKRLYDDLRAKGVPCWYSPHDMRGGRNIQKEIEDAIKLTDRLLLILSSHSRNSEWVKTEIAHARQKEINENR